MGLQREIIETELRTNASQSQGELASLEGSTGSLIDKNKQLKLSMSKLEAEGKKNSASYKNLNKLYKQNSIAITENKGKMELLRKEIGITGLTAKQLRQEANRLKREMNDMTKSANPTRWNELNNKLKQVERQQERVRTGSSRLKGGMGLLQKAIPILSITYFIGLLTRLGGKLKEIAVQLSDSQADVQKTTNLTKKEVQELTSDLDKLNTRSAREELLSLARIAGKLGERGKNDVEGFVEAADKINVALSEDLGGDIEETVRQLGKLVDIFGVRKEFGIKDGLLKVGSAINAIGANSTASEQYLVDFTKRLAGVATQADISLPQVFGYASALDQLGQSSEVSATTLNRVWVEMFKDVDTYSGIAGMSVVDFNELLQTDADAAFKAFLKGLNGNNEGLTIMANKLEGLGLKGARATQVLSILASNTELITSEQKLANEEFKKGTSLTEEFNTKNNNLAANLKKVGNRIKNYLVGSRMVNFLNKWASGIEKITRSHIKNSEQLSDQRHQMNAYFNLLTSGNISLEHAQKIRKKLNDQYADYLPNLISEKTSLEEIKIAQEEANKKFLERIKLEAGREVLEEKKKAILELQKEMIDKEIKLEEKEAALQKLKEENSANPDKARRNAFKGERKNNAVEKAQMDIRELTEEIKVASEEYDKYLAKLLESDPDALNTTSSNTTTTPTSTGGGGPSKDTIKKQQKVYDQLEKLTSDYLKSQMDANEKEIHDVEDKYNALIEKAIDAGSDVTEIEAQRDIEISALNEKHTKAAQEKELEARKQFEQEKKDLLLQYQEQTLDELEEAEKLRLEEKYIEGLDRLTEQREEEILSEEEFRERKLELETNYGISANRIVEYFRDLRKSADKQEWQDKLAHVQAYVSAAQSLLGGLSDYVTSNKRIEITKLEREEQKRLANVERGSAQEQAIIQEFDNKKFAIEKEYADKAFHLKIAQINASTAQGIMNVWGNNTLPYPYAAIFNGIMTGVIATQGIAQGIVAKRERDSVRQLYTGKYDVIGASDGRHYSAPYVGAVNETGFVNNGQPTLINEQGGELLISTPHVDNMRLNYPHLLQGIMDTRVSQRAEGNYEAAEEVPAATQNNEIMLRVANTLDSLDAKLPFIRGVFSYEKLKELEAEITEIEDFAAGN